VEEEEQEDEERRYLGSKTQEAIAQGAGHEALPSASGAGPALPRILLE